MSNTKFVRMPTSKQMLAMGVPELPEAAFGGDLPPVQRKALVQAMGIRPQGGGGGGLKAVVAVVAAVAIPVAAPAIAASIGASAAIGTALTTAGISAATAATTGAVLGSAIVGAGLGAVTAAVTGQNVGKSALMGGIGGGIGGYFSAPSVPTSAVSPQAMAAANASSDPIAALNASQGWTAATPQANLAVTSGGQVATMENGVWMAGGQAVPAESIAYGGQVDSALAAQLSSSGDAMGAANAIQQSGTLSVNTPAAMGGNAGYLGTTNYYNPATATAAPGAYTGANGQAFTPSANYQQAGLAITPQAEAAATVQAAYSPTGVAGAQPTTGTTGTGGTAGGTATQQAPTSVWQALQQKFTDPKQQADMLLRAAGQLAGSQLAGEGLTPEQQDLVNQQAEELKKLKETNSDLFNERLAWAQGLLGESRYFDPEYFGLQAQRGVQTTGARAKREAMRKLQGKGKAGLRAAEERRYDLGIATGGEQAYLQGADAAQQNKLKTMQAGVSQLPTGAPDYTNQYSALLKTYGDAEASRNARAQNIGNFFGDITGTAKSQNRGLNLSFG